MSACVRCGIDTRDDLCRDCLDVVGDEVAREVSLVRRLGELVDERSRIEAEIVALAHEIEPAAKFKRPRSIVPLCGTESAYQRHRNRREECPDGDACKVAHARHERIQAIVRRIRNDVA